MSITRRRLLVYAVMLASLLVVINLVKDIIRLSKADERLSASQAELTEAKKQQEELKRNLAVAGDGFWLEKQIRNVLKMAKPEEVVVVVPEEIVRASEIAAVGEAQRQEESNLSQWLKAFGFWPVSV